MASFHQKCCGNSSSSLTFSSSSIRSDFSLSLYLLSGTMLVCLLKFNWNQLFFEKMEAVYLKLYTQAQYRSVLLLGFLFKRFPRNELPNDSGFPQYKTLYLQAQWHFSALEESFSLLLSLSYMPEERVVSRYMQHHHKMFKMNLNRI